MKGTAQNAHAHDAGADRRGRDGRDPRYPFLLAGLSTRTHSQLVAMNVAAQPRDGHVRGDGTPGWKLAP